MMRKMFQDPAHPIVTPFTVWFDDDSCLAPQTTAVWWSNLHKKMQAADMVGKLYRMRVQGYQAEGISRQKWFRGKEINPKTHRFVFATGSWWCCRTQILQQWDYPFPDLVHNGGDTVLGELMRQQSLVYHKDFIFIHPYSSVMLVVYAHSN